MGDTVILSFSVEQIIPGSPLVTIAWNHMSLAIKIEVIVNDLSILIVVDLALVEGVMGLRQSSCLVAQSLA